MITHAAVVPQPPLLVPEISPEPSAELAALREACLTAARRLGDRWIAVGAYSGDLVVGPEVAGSFRGYGVDVQVSLAEGAHGEQVLPLPALIAGWLREHAGARQVEVHLVAGTASAEHCAALGARLADRDDTGLLVLGDGSNRHGPKSPGSEDERAPGFDDVVAKALAKADTEALLALDPALAGELGAGGRVPWQVLAGTGSTWHGDLLYSAAPFGVGYHVAVWERA
ncbi:MAG TPA: class III extradiol dioxygenase subunit B-like domain-containing protein [Amycolatopsis sp.]|nr:class III extradiol dioxygenase subunit B-like domain-containing protein [Amycolatopsis sp.]